MCSLYIKNKYGINIVKIQLFHCRSHCDCLVFLFDLKCVSLFSHQKFIWMSDHFQRGIQQRNTLHSSSDNPHTKNILYRKTLIVLELLFVLHFRKILCFDYKKNNKTKSFPVFVDCFKKYSCYKKNFSRLVEMYIK